jgi:hypothetical protein
MLQGMTFSIGELAMIALVVVVLVVVLVKK